MNDEISIQLQFSEIIKKDSVVLFLKGCANFPICGLSSTVSHILKKNKIPHSCVNLLGYPNLHKFLRDKYYPIVAPYLFVNSKFVGGFDEITALHNAGKLDALFNDKKLL